MTDLFLLNYEEFDLIRSFSVVGAASSRDSATRMIAADIYSITIFAWGGNKIDKQTVAEAADFIRKQIQATPLAGILTGTGLGEAVAGMEVKTALDYAHIPHFPAATVIGHTGKLLIGTLGRKSILVLQGRFHLYEGYDARQVTLPIRILQALGVKNVILLNAAGGLNLDFQAGDIMAIKDHINLTGCNPLRGPNEDEWGPRFPDMTSVYDPQLRALAARLAKKLNLRLQQGSYAGLLGPSLETPAETRYLRSIGADAVGFSTVMEAIAAAHAGMRILGLSIITNLNDSDRPERTTVEAVIQVARTAAAPLSALLGQILEQMDEPPSTHPD